MTTKKYFYFFLLFSSLSVFLNAQSDAVHRRMSIEQPQQRSVAARTGLSNPWPKPVPAAGMFPLAIGIIPPVQVPEENWDVTGIRLNILAGRHNNVAIIDIGTLANLAIGEVVGVEVAGLWNQAEQGLMGVQVAGIGNRVYGDTTGLQIAGVVNYNGAGETTGMQIAAVNVNQGKTTGVQIGLYNQVEEMDGIQIGVFNIASHLGGMQLGLCNLIRNSPLPFMVILNFGF